VISTNINACVMVCSVVAHKSEGTHIEKVGSKMSKVALEDEVSSHVAG